MGSVVFNLCAFAPLRLGVPFDLTRKAQSRGDEKVESDAPAISGAIELFSENTLIL